jgi:hypothetical protein
MQLGMDYDRSMQAVNDQVKEKAEDATSLAELAC